MEDNRDPIAATNQGDSLSRAELREMAGSKSGIQLYSQVDKVEFNNSEWTVSAIVSQQLELTSNSGQTMQASSESVKLAK